ncbi:MAG: protein kinase [Anaerolineae bacterium]|nr:protein kinase [Anaerolineae bacterium]MDW8072027.1 protein kinase [Anaerolineae bacterium]
MQQPGPSSPDTTIIGRLIGKYRVIEPIGGGGVSTVYKAYQPDLDRYVALKILSPYHASRAEFARRFIREARAVAALHHPNILPVYDFGEHDGLRYIVMRYVEGSHTLKDEMAYPMSLMRVVDVISQVASALDHAHHHGVIHRDVKPSNILMDGRWALLTDFGLAKTPYESGDLTQSGLGVGTPAYMSPEQGQGLPFDHRTDVYSLGVIVYEILTGEVPHNAETPFAIVLRRATEPPEMTCTRYPEVTSEVKAVVLKALAIDPADRFQSAGAFACALRKAVLQYSTEPEDESARATRPAFRILPVPARWLHKGHRSKALGWNVRRRAAPFGALAIAALSVVTTAYLALSSTDSFAPPPLPVQITATPSVEALSARWTTPSVTIFPTPMLSPTPTSTSLAEDGVLYRVKEGERERLYITRLTGEKTIRLTDAFSSVTGAFCGSSTRILVQAKEGERATFYLVNADGSDRQVLVEGVDEGWAYCSEDGRKVLAAWRRETNWEAVVLDTEDARRTMLTYEASALKASWDPQWHVAAVLQGRGDSYTIHLVDLTTHEVSSLRCERCVAELSHPLVSPHAYWLLYRACQSPVTYALKMVDIQRGDTLQLATSLALPNISFAPSGDKLLVSIMPVANAPLELHLLDLADGRSVSLLNGEAVGGTFSPDARWLALWTRRAGTYHLYVADGDGSAITAVAQGDPYAAWLEFSADSSWALATVQRDGYYHVYRVRSDGTQLQPIVTARQAADWYADAFFSADNEQLLVRLGHSSPRRSSMYLVELRSGRWIELVRDAAWQPAAVFTADGRYLVFESNRHGGRAIYVADLERGTTRRLADGFAPVLGARQRAVAFHPVSSLSSDVPITNPCASLFAEERHESLPAPTPTAVPMPTSTPTLVYAPTRQPAPEGWPTFIPPTPGSETLPSVPEIVPPPRPPENSYAAPQLGPTRPPSPVQLPPLTLETWVSSASSAPGQPITLGVRNIWGKPGEVYEFVCTVYAPDGSATSASGVLQGDAWSYLLYPGGFAGATASIGGDYTMVCMVADQQVTAHFFVDEDIRGATVEDDR